MSLLRWYRKHKRRSSLAANTDPYRILVSEVMLQQTQVQTVIPYYRRWLKTFPTFQTLAKAPLNKVLKRWEGLGIILARQKSSRAGKNRRENIHGRLPSTFDELKALPGIGRYTAGAILSIAFQKPFPSWTEMWRGSSAAFSASGEDIALPKTQAHLWIWPRTRSTRESRRLQPGIDGTGRDDLHATCTRCPRCPLNRGCRAKRLELQDRLPVKKKKQETPHFHIGAGVIWHKGKF